MNKILRVFLYTSCFTGVFLSLLAAGFPEWVELLYSQSVYRWTVPLLSRITGVFPFSVAELLVVSLLALALYLLVRGTLALARSRRLSFKFSLKRLGHLVLLAAAIHTAFILIWGLSYHRPAFADLAGMDVRPGSVEELAQLTRQLVQRTNELRQLVNEDENGVMRLSGSIRDMFMRADLGYQEAAKIYPELGGSYGRPKGVVNTWYMSATGIGGIYMPFTAEANVNVAMPHLVLPFTTTHEMAHQRGFAREDEANYIAYLTCILHPDLDFQYSGMVNALLYSLSALRRHDPDLHREIRELISEEVQRDLDAWSAWWSKYNGGIMQRVSDRVNDAYLRANRQTDGIQSYGRMVDLLLAEQRQQGDAD